MKVTYIHFHNGVPRYVGEGEPKRKDVMYRGDLYGSYLSKHRGDHFCVLQLSTHGDKVASWLQEQGLISWLGRKVEGTGPLMNVLPFGSGHPLGMSEDGRRRCAEAAANMVWTDEMREACRQRNLGKKWGPEFGKAVSKALKGKPKPQSYVDWFHENNPMNVTVTCPHCGKEGHIGAMKRWHFDYCLKNPNALERPKVVARKRGPQPPQERITCPHCGKTGGKSAMKRYHFDNCKHKP